MKPIKLFLFYFIFILLFSGCSRGSDWVQFRGEGGRGVSSSRISPPLGVRWKIKLQLDERTLKSLNPPVVLGDTIYFGSDDGNFYALDIKSGYMRWVYRSGAEINSIPYADKNLVYFGSKDGYLYALSRKTGDEVWKFAVNSQINSQVERYKDYIVFVADAEAIYFLSPDGEEKFKIRNQSWYNFTFLMSDDIFYFAPGPTPNLLGPYDINKQQYLWYLPYNYIAASWYSFPALKGDLLYFGTADVEDVSLGFYAYNRHTGKLVWEQRADAILDGSYYDIFEFFTRNYDILDFLAPAVWKNLVIFSGGDKKTRAFDAKTGVLKWQREFDLPVSSAPTIAGDRIYFGVSGDGFTSPQLVCLQASNGRFLWSMDIEGSILSAPVIAGKRIIFGTDKSVFYVLEEVF